MRPVAHVGAALVVITLSRTSGAGWQEPASPAPSQADTDALVTRFLAAGEEYQKTFLNLTAEETRLVEIFDQTGRVEKRREIVSDLVIYQPPRDSGSEGDDSSGGGSPAKGGKQARLSTDDETTEYRDVRSVDGKLISKRSVRAVDLLTRASKSKSITKELALIDRESARYDLDYRFFGSTSQSGLMLREREKFRVDWAGRDRVSGHDVVVLDYQEVAPNRNNPDQQFYEHYGLSASLIRGRLWLDVTTSRLRRERWEFTGIHPELSQPVTIVRREAVYAESRFGILVPERVDFEWFNHAKPKKNQAPTFFRGARGTCTYREFRQFDVAAEQTIRMPSAPEK